MYYCNLLDDSPDFRVLQVKDGYNGEDYSLGENRPVHYWLLLVVSRKLHKVHYKKCIYLGRPYL